MPEFRRVEEQPMKRYAYLRRAGDSWQLADFEDRQPVDSPAEVAGIMVSRLDFDVQAIELPAMAEKEVEGFLTYRIRSLYPGQPDQTAFDYRILARGGKRYAVLFLFQRETLEEYRRVAAGRPLFSSISLLLPLLGAKRAGRGPGLPVLGRHLAGSPGLAGRQSPRAPMPASAGRGPRPSWTSC